MSDRLLPYINISDSGPGDTFGWCNPHRSKYRTYMILEPDATEEQKDSHSYAFAGSGDRWWNGNSPSKVATYKRGDVDYARYWDDPADQPVPAGWRIPSDDQFRAIFPATPFAGNIACLKGGNSTPVLRMKLWGSDNARNVYISMVDELVDHGKQIRLIRE